MKKILVQLESSQKGKKIKDERISQYMLAIFKGLEFIPKSLISTQKNIQETETENHPCDFSFRLGAHSRSHRK